MKKVFLGGTFNKSVWRDILIPYLDIDYFKPVDKYSNTKCQEEQIRQRNICDFVLYTITPKMKGFSSIARVVDDSNKRPEKTILCILPFDNDNSFDYNQKRSLNTVAEMIENNGGKVFRDLWSVAEYLNRYK